MVATLSKIAALVVTTSATARLGNLQAAVPYFFSARGIRVSQLPALMPWVFSSNAVRLSQQAALVTWTAGVHDVPRTSQMFALVPWGTTPPGDENRTRAWAFTLDGHLFYVLDLGQEGTYLYDMDTGQWWRARTGGYLGWNMRVGTTWQAPNRVMAGDTLNGYVWEMSPTDLLDEEFRTIEHIVTGGVVTRSRVSLGVESVRIAGSIGQVQDDIDGIATSMRFSDDAGKTWSEPMTVLIDQGNFDKEIAYRSLGSFAAPGRVFEFSDIGGMLRIDGADLFLENFDDEQELGSG